MLGCVSSYIFNILTWRRNLLAIKASGETSDWLQVGQTCSSDSNKLVRIPVEMVNMVSIYLPLLKMWFFDVYEIMQFKQT